MTDNAGSGHTHKSLSETLGALAPGGMAAIGFDDYKRLFGSEPTEDQIEGERAGKAFADKHGVEHEVDHRSRIVKFFKPNK